MTTAESNNSGHEPECRRLQYVGRRRFLQGLAVVSGALVIGFEPLARAWITTAHADSRMPSQLPQLDGTLHLDDASLDDCSYDIGRNLQRRQIAVLKPGSVQDEIKMVEPAPVW